MSMLQVEKIYAAEKEIEEFNNAKKQILKEQDAIRQIFENGSLLTRWSFILEKLNALDAVFGMLNELTPEQRETFEEAVKRRPLFK